MSLYREKIDSLFSRMKNLTLTKVNFKTCKISESSNLI